jgi:hypothetical protein
MMEFNSRRGSFECLGRENEISNQNKKKIMIAMRALNPNLLHFLYLQSVIRREKKREILVQDQPEDNEQQEDQNK